MEATMNDLQGFWWTMFSIARMWLPIEVRWPWRARPNR